MRAGCWHCRNTRKCSCSTCVEGLPLTVREAPCKVCKPKDEIARGVARLNEVINAGATSKKR
jgi:hypothetical protein